MRYIPAAVAALGISSAVIFGLYLTKNPWCLAGFIFLFYVKKLLPSEAIKITEKGDFTIA